jgi:hypothetical protein
MEESLTISAAIARVEGWGIAGDIPTRDNNPGDIIAGKFTEREGATGTDAKNQRFATFATPDDGFKALRDLLNGAPYIGATIHDALNIYAPPVENDTSAYEATVCQLTGLTPDTILTAENIG